MRLERKIQKLEKKAFIDGYACALAQLIRLFDRPSMAVDMAQNAGFSASDFKDVDYYDRKVIMKAFKDK